MGPGFCYSEGTVKVVRHGEIEKEYIEVPTKVEITRFQTLDQVEANCNRKRATNKSRARATQTSPGTVAALELGVLYPPVDGEEYDYIEGFAFGAMNEGESAGNE
jgi:hypothetical protein